MTYRLLSIILLTFSLILFGQNQHNLSCAQYYQREAEYHTKRAAAYENEADYYRNRSEYYLREAEWYTRNNRDKESITSQKKAKTATAKVERLSKIASIERKKAKEGLRLAEKLLRK